jgi:recombination protein RecT
MSQELTTLKQTLTSEAMREQFAKALPSHLSPERFIRIALTALTRTPKLADCTQASLMRCLLDLSALGLEPDGRLAHLIPYGKDCTLIIDYKGLVDLARRSGVTIRAEVVCEHDQFDWVNGVVTHRVDWRKPRGEVQAVYAEGSMKDGEIQTATMTRDEVDAIRKRSKSGGNGPWVTDWAEMAKKTAVRRLAKMLPLSPEFRDALDKDDDKLAERDVTPAKVPSVSFLPEKQAVPAIEQESPKGVIERIADAGLKWGDVGRVAEANGILVAIGKPWEQQSDFIQGEVEEVLEALISQAKEGK